MWGITSADYHPLALNCQIFGPFFDHESAVQLLTSCPVWSPVRTVGPALSGLRCSHAPCSRAHKPFLLLLSLNLSCSSGDTRLVDTQVPPVNFRLFPALCLALAAPALGSWGAWEPSSEAARWSSASLLPAPPSQRCSSTIQSSAPPPGLHSQLSHYFVTCFHSFLFLALFPCKSGLRTEVDFRLHVLGTLGPVQGLGRCGQCLPLDGPTLLPGKLPLLRCFLLLPQRKTESCEDV